DGRRDLQLDPVPHAGALPVAARDRGVLLADVAAEQLSVGRQTSRDADRGVAGERADLDRVPRPDQPDQHREQLTLVVGDLHGELRGQVAVRLLGEVAQYDVRGLGVGDQVLVDGGVHDVHARESAVPGQPVNRPTWAPVASYQST